MARNTVRKQKFIENLGLGMTQSQAAANAGFKNPRAEGYRLMQDPEVQHAVSLIQAQNAKDFDMTREKVLEGLAEAIRDAKLLSDPSAQIAGWREIAKICGFYAPEEKRITITDTQRRIVTRYETLSEEELLRMIEAQGGALIEGEVVKDDEDTDLPDL